MIDDFGPPREVIRAANADLAHAGAEPRLDEEATVDALCAITDKMAEQDYVPSTTCDFLSGNRMEVEAIFKEPLRRATRLRHGDGHVGVQGQVRPVRLSARNRQDRDRVRCARSLGSGRDSLW